MEIGKRIGKGRDRQKARRARLGIAALAATVVSASVMARARTTDELYVAARNEGELVLYMGGEARAAHTLADSFERAFPGIEVRTFALGGSSAVAARIDELRSEGKLDADVATLQTVQNFVRWARQGALLRFKPSGFDAVRANLKDKNGFFVGIQMTPAVYVYNTEKVSRADVPKSALDFLNPRFRGRIISSYPQDDEATMYVFFTIIRKYGWGYMEKYMANEPKFVRGSHAKVVHSIATGDSYVTFDPNAANIAAEQAAGSPVGIAYPVNDDVPLWWGAVGIFKGAAHPNAAKLFITWLLSKKRQLSANTWSPRTDIPLPSGLCSLSALHLADGYATFLLDDKLVANLRVRFAKIIGPVK